MITVTEETKSDFFTLFGNVANEFRGGWFRDKWKGVKETDLVMVHPFSVLCGVYMVDEILEDGVSLFYISDPEPDWKEMSREEMEKEFPAGYTVFSGEHPEAKVKAMIQVEKECGHKDTAFLSYRSGREKRDKLRIEMERRPICRKCRKKKERIEKAEVQK